MWNQLPSLACSDGDIGQLSSLSLKKQLKRIKREARQYTGNRYLFDRALLEADSYSRKHPGMAVIYQDNSDEDYEEYDNEDSISTTTTTTATTSTTTKTDGKKGFC